MCRLTPKFLVAATAVALGTSALVAQTWVTFDGTTVPTPPTVTTIEADAYHVTYEVSLHGMLVQDTTVDGVLYQIISLPDEGEMADTGKPQIPHVTRLVGFGQGASVSAVSEFSAEQTFEDYYIFPGQIPASDTYPPPEYPFLIDSATYATDSFYPAEEDANVTAELGIWRDLGVAAVGILPFRFNPVQRTLVAYTSVTATFTFAGGDPLPGEVFSPYYQAYAGTVDNFAHIGIQQVPNPPPLQYVIILGKNSTGLRAAIEPLRVWKELQGYATSVWYVGTHMQRDQYSIRDFIANWYNPGSYSTFILFVGDQDLIPSPEDWVHPDGDYMYCDHWYSCVSHPGDYLSDIPIGRVPTGDPEVVAAVVDKIMAYERYIDPEWDNLKVLTVTWKALGYHNNKEEIAGLLEPLGVVFSRQHGLTPGVTNATVKQEIQGSNGVGVINYRGHGYIQEWPDWNEESPPEDFTNADILELTNSTRLPIVYEVACCCGNIGPDEGHAETWVEHPDGGGVGALAATRSSYTRYNNPFDYYLWAIPYSVQVPRCDFSCVTLAIWCAKLKMLCKYCWYHHAHANNKMYHWLGDPSLHIWIADSGHLALEYSPVTIPPEIPSTIRACVRRPGGTPVKNAAVGLYKVGDPEPELLTSHLSDENGEASFDVNVPTEGTITIAASKPLFRSSEGTILVWRKRGSGRGISSEPKSKSFPGRFELSVQALSRRQVRLLVAAPSAMKLGVAIYDAIGRRVLSIPDLGVACGSHWVDITKAVPGGRGLRPGTYFLEYCCDFDRGLRRVTGSC